MSRGTDDYSITMDQCNDSKVTNQLLKDDGRRFGCLIKILVSVVFFLLLLAFCIAVVSLVYIAIHPQDFVLVKPLKPEQYPAPLQYNASTTGYKSEQYEPSSSGKNDKKTNCKEHYEYLSNFRTDTLVKNIWISLVIGIIGWLASVATISGILLTSPNFMDLGAIYLFVYGIHKAFVAVILFLVKCPGVFFFEYVVFAEPSVALLSLLDADVKISIAIIHVILSAVAFCVLMFTTCYRNHLVKEYLRNMHKKKEIQVFPSSEPFTTDV